MQEVNISKIIDFIHMKRLVPKPNTFITMRDLLVSGVITQVRDGVKILAGVSYI
jgi:hypothetical protein